MKSIRRAYLEKNNNKGTLGDIYIKTDNFQSENINQFQKNSYINQEKKKKIESSRKKENKDNQFNDINIEILLKELDNLEKENKLLSNEIISSKKEEQIQKENYNKIINDINRNKIELNKLKEINTKKNREYSQLRNNHREMMIRDIRDIHRDTVNELNRQSLHRFFDRLVFLSRMRRENNSGNAMTDEQIQALPISYYPRNNNTNECCIICGFPFCYNDVIIKINRCNHIFHKACLINSLTVTRSSICPICRNSII